MEQPRTIYRFLILLAASVLCGALAASRIGDPVSFWIASAVFGFFAFQRIRMFNANKSIGGAQAGGLLALENDADPSEFFGVDLVIVYKHSTQCPTSLMALRQVLAFAREYEDTTVYGVNVIEQRGLSNRIAEHLDVRHASPQLIVIRKGAVTGCLNHHSIRAEAMEALLEV